MASELNTALSSVERIPGTLDPSPYLRPMELSGATCNQSIPSPSCSYVPQDSPSSCLSEQSVRKHSSSELLNDKLKVLLNQKLVGMVLRGRISDSLQHHRMTLIRELADWIKPFTDLPDSYDARYRNQLLSLFATVSKQTVKNIPFEYSEWLKLFNQWIRCNSEKEVIFDRKIFEILAVDGFRGIGVKDLKQYLGGILLPVRVEYRTHIQGIRAMYEHFDENLIIESLIGTDSACVIFLALLHLYINHLEIFDDQVFIRVRRARLWAEGFLHNHRDYYRDLKQVNENVLTTLGNVYTQQFHNDEEWKKIGKELIKHLNIPSTVKPPTKKKNKHK